MTFLRSAAHAATIAALLAACTDGDDDKSDDVDDTDVAAFTVLTYNAGLAIGFVPAADDRAPGTAQAVVDLGADVVCLQEVWVPEHVQAFRDAAAGTYPHVYFPEPAQESSDTPACAEDELDALLTCIENNCGDACVDDLPGCLLSSCALPFLGLSDDCNRCTQANVGGEPEDIRELCTTGSVEYAYGGSFGTGILSRFPLGQVVETLFSSTTNRRSVLQTTLDLPGARDAELLCTHLTADLTPLPYPRESGTWAEEQEVQIHQLVTLVENATEDLVILAGDLNTGPEYGDVEGALPDHYALLAATRLENAYVEADQPCTYCADNELNRDTQADETIDHVLVAGASEVTARRVLTDPITAMSCDTQIDAHPSDHYGVLAEITP